MRYRVLIFEDDDSIRSALWQFFDSLGYEVFTFPDPSLCPLNEKQFCDCPLEHACSDIILSDINMPQVKGIDFIKDMKRKGCKVNNIAIMSGDWTIEAIEEAGKFGLKVIEKPFKFEDLEDWLDKCEKGLKENRKLSDWFIYGKKNSLE
jgi:DNA-binding NtrC family response regulator